MKKFIKKVSSFFKSIVKEEQLTRRQEIAFRVFQLCLYDKDNILYYSSGNTPKRYIVNREYLNGNDVSTFVILESGVNLNNVTIVNHHYSYDVPIPNSLFNKMLTMFDEKVVEERKKMEEELLGNITRSLETVLFDLEVRLGIKV